MPKHAQQIVIPIRLSLPVHSYADAFVDESYRFLLDSALEGALGRYSFLGLRPWEVFRVDDARVSDLDPFVELQQLAESLKVKRADVPGSEDVPFLGGAIGWFGYGARHSVERLPHHNRERVDPLPDVCFAFVDDVLAFDHKRSTAFLAITGRGDSAAEAEQSAERQLFTRVGQIRRFERSAKHRMETGRGAELKSRCSPEAYRQLVERSRQHILSGDAFEICLTRQVQAKVPYLDSWALYKTLREITPAPFAAFFSTPDGDVLSASPERFLSVSESGIAESRPIKGTRPRGSRLEEDVRLRSELVTSEKDRAENLMIVDLVRNDLGRVCEVGSVEVPELLAVEEYATVFQLVSTVRGQLPDRTHALDAVRACFPGGSMTGAPKIEAMKILDRLEPVERGLYSGALGYLDHSGALDLSIVIRTLVASGEQASFGVGGAVVVDSDPLAELEETEDKARALIAAIDRISLPLAEESG